MESTHIRNRIVHLAILRLVRILGVLLGTLQFYLVVNGFACVDIIPLHET